jgi:type I restriction enzyme S subunit
MQQVSHGTTQDNLSLDKLLRFNFVVPDVDEQRKIAAILSAYDDLIENNLRRIKILEEMAQNLYREWFVKFRFPGHEKVRFVETTLGRIPEGWEVVTLGDLAVVVTKGTTPTTLGKAFKSDGVNFFKVESIDQDGGVEENKLAKIDSETHELLKRSQLLEGDILFSIAGAIGRTTIVHQRLLPANTNQALAIIRISNKSIRDYIFQCVRADEFQNFSLGRVVQTAQANVSLGILKSVPIVMPPKGLLGEFTVVAASLLKMKENIRTKNAILRRTRDLLLPKLISGEVDVSELEIAIPEEALI